MKSSARADSGTQRPGKSVPRVALDREAWIAAAFEEVVRGGFSQVRVLPLSTLLGVTRGSFYWHFKDHEELVDAVIDRWRDGQIGFLNTRVAEPEEPPAAYLERVIREHIAAAKGDFVASRIETAIRSFSARNAHARAACAEVDARRFKFAREIFRPLVKDTGTLAELAVLLYVNVIGGQLTYAYGHGFEIRPERLAASIARTLLARAVS